jgi:ATP-dependent RNA helicase CshB
LIYSNNLNDPKGALLGLLKNINPYFGIIFANTKNIANEIYELLLNTGVNVTLLHKDLTTRQRKNVYLDLQNHRFQYLVATDLASRGLDIEGVDVVISFGLPDDDI